MPKFLLKALAKELAAVPDPEGDFRQRRVGLVQQGGGVGEAGAGDVALGRLAHPLTKACREGVIGSEEAREVFRWLGTRFSNCTDYRFELVASRAG
jgi:hypothetical protein